VLRRQVSFPQLRVYINIFIYIYIYIYIYMSIIYIYICMYCAWAHQYSCMIFRGCNIRDPHSKPYIHSKEPYIHSNEPYRYTNEPCIHSEEPHCSMRNPLFVNVTCNCESVANSSVRQMSHGQAAAVHEPSASNAVGLGRKPKWRLSVHPVNREDGSIQINTTYPSLNRKKDNSRMHTHTNTHARAHARTHTQTHTRKHTRTHAHTHTHTHTHIHTRAFSAAMTLTVKT